ncbi:MAG TPA: DUF106 domain-containing protein [Candidatus Woesearchaeota archaeon]|nr:DUF106 domain-containing protein [Candidatus Woesearchaeota archaeon]
MVFENILDPIFSPLLDMPPVLAILLISFIITLAITLVYKFTTDQEKMKKLKQEMKEYQKKIKTLSKEDPHKAMAIQQKAMKRNLEYMKSSFKSTLYTLIPILIIFGWLNTHMAYYPLAPNQSFEVTAFFAQGHAPSVTLSSIPELKILNNATQPINDGKATWELIGSEGEYKLIINYNEEEYTMPLLISSKRKYAPPEKKISDSKLKKIVISNEKIYPLKDVLGLKLNWLWTYILFSVIISIALRKVLRVY